MACDRVAAQGVPDLDQLTWAVDDRLEDVGTLESELRLELPRGLFTELVVFRMSDRAATEQELTTTEGFTRLDVSLGYSYERLELELSCEDLDCTGNAQLTATISF